MCERPDLSYCDLVRLALLSKPDGRATLRQIYEYIEESFPYFKVADGSRFWKNSVRHTLCKNRQFQRIDGALSAAANGKPYKRGSTVWQLCGNGTENPQAHRKGRLIKKKPGVPADPQAKPSSLDATVDVLNYSCPWQLSPVEHKQLDVAVGQPNICSQPVISESSSPDREMFFKPWTSPHQQLTAVSHLEAPRPDELRLSPSEAVVYHSLYQPCWLYEQDCSTHRGVLDPSGLMAGPWSKATSSALRAASPVSQLANSACCLSYHHNNQLAENQSMYTDGFFWYPG